MRGRRARGSRDTRAPRCCRRLARARACAAIERPEMRERAVRQHHALLEHVIDGLAVEHRAGAARVVGHHAADGGAARRRHVGREAQVVRAQRRVQLVEHHAGLDARPSLVGIDLEDAIQVLRGVEHEAGADRLAGLRRAAASRRDRHAVPRGDLDGAHHRLGRSRDDDAERLDLVDAGVGRIQRARHLDRSGPRRRSRASSSRCRRSEIRHLKSEIVTYWLLPRAAIGHTASTRSPRSA